MPKKWLPECEKIVLEIFRFKETSLHVRPLVFEATKTFAKVIGKKQLHIERHGATFIFLTFPLC